MEEEKIIEESVVEEANGDVVDLENDFVEVVEDQEEVINEEEYTSTLKYLIEDSKNQLIKINEETFITEQKIHELNLVNISLDSANF